ncbi:MAG: UvrD-helicase domain-containing protein [Candidatus Nanopelagicales bacterium]
MTQLGFDLDELPPFGPDELVALLGVPFSDEQMDAITAPLEPCVVVAGAGSGKTTVMTARVVWLVATGQVQPEQVLGLTFTTKAAGELSSRVRAAVQRFSDRVSGRPLDEIGEPTVATYHAFAGRLIAEHGLRIGVEPGARLLGEAASVQLAHRVVTRTARDLSTLGYAVSTIVESVRSLDSELAEHCLGPAELREHDLAVVAEVDAEAKPSADSLRMRTAALTRIELSHLVEEFRAARAARDLVDFSDQMRFGARLAEECPDVGAALREQFRVVLLDEYQDTSVSQRRLLAGLFGGGHPVTAVGDPLQAIYGWRGASVANIDRFPQHFARADGRDAPS